MKGYKSSLDRELREQSPGAPGVRSENFRKRVRQLPGPGPNAQGPTTLGSSRGPGPGPGVPGTRLLILIFLYPAQSERPIVQASRLQTNLLPTSLQAHKYKALASNITALAAEAGTHVILDMPSCKIEKQPLTLARPYAISKPQIMPREVPISQGKAMCLVRHCGHRNQAPRNPDFGYEDLEASKLVPVSAPTAATCSRRTQLAGAATGAMCGTLRQHKP